MKEKRKNKGTRTNKRSKAEAPTSASSSKDVVQLPEAVAELVCGNVIDLSGASNFYRKKANVATLLEGFVELLPNSHFRYDEKRIFQRDSSVILA